MALAGVNEGGLFFAAQLGLLVLGVGPGVHTDFCANQGVHPGQLARMRAASASDSSLTFTPLALRSATALDASSQVS